MWRQARRDGTRVAAMVLDLDHFKRLNDAHGHAAGDAVLRAVAGSLTATVRPADVLARTGGEELVVLGLVGDPDEARAAGRASPDRGGRQPDGRRPRRDRLDRHRAHPARPTARTPPTPCGGWSTAPTRPCTRPSSRAGTGSRPCGCPGRRVPAGRGEHRQLRRARSRRGLRRSARAVDPAGSLLRCAHDAGRARPHADGSAAAAGAGRRPRPVADPAPARPAARPHGPRRHRPVAGHRARVQRGPGAGHAAAGHLAVGPPAHDPRAAPQRRRRHPGRGLPLSGRPVPAGVVARRGARPAGGGVAVGRRPPHRASRPTRGASASTSPSPSRWPTGCRTPSTGCSPRRSGPTPTGSCRPRSSPSAGWRPGCRRRSGRCTPSTGSCTR